MGGTGSGVLWLYLVDNDFSPNANHSGDSAYVLIRLLFYYCQLMSVNDCSDWRLNKRERAICRESIVANVYLHFRTFPYKSNLEQIFIPISFYLSTET